MPLLAPPPGLPMLVGLAGMAGFGGNGGGTPPPRDADIVGAGEAELSLAKLTSDREDKSPLSSPSWA